MTISTNRRRTVAISARGGGRIQAVVYTVVPGFIPIHLKPDGDTINADRTKTLSLLLTQHNNGENHYPHKEELRIELYKHLGTTKKIRERNALGDIVEKFIKTDKQDHWVHSLNYCNIAAMALEEFEDTSVVGSMPGTTSVKVGSAAEPKPELQVTGMLAGMFGFMGRR